MNKTKTNKPVSDEEINQTAELLSRLEPGFLPLSIFHQIARLMVMSIVELVPFRRTEDGGVEVLLTRRSEDDKFWPNLLHTPGTVFRATDMQEGGHNSALRRIFEDELEIDYQEATFAECIAHKTLRGVDSACIYWVELKNTPSIGEFYNTNNLPQDVIGSSIEVIEEALKHYLQ
jgi:hypothetical protein